MAYSHLEMNEGCIDMVQMRTCNKPGSLAKEDVSSLEWVQELPSRSWSGRKASCRYCHQRENQRPLPRYGSSGL
jgi:hypothetical protein